MEFIKDRWYKYNKWYIKFKEKNTNGIFKSSEEIFEGFYRECYSNFGQCDDSKILLTDLSEIQDFLPDGHIDKIINKIIDTSYLIEVFDKLKIK